jgi:hypothetical protein
MRCELTPEAVRCHATNFGDDYTVDCVEPYLGVKETGEVFNGTKRWCSGAIAPGATNTFDAIKGVRPADHCGPELDGCVLTTFTGKVDVAEIAAFVRKLEAAAPHLGGNQPTMQECDDARRAWLATPEIAERYKSLQLDEADVIDLFCKLHVSRELLQCFARAQTTAAVEACADAENAH